MRLGCLCHSLYQHICKAALTHGTEPETQLSPHSVQSSLVPPYMLQDHPNVPEGLDRALPQAGKSVNMPSGSAVRVKCERTPPLLQQDACQSHGSTTHGVPKPGHLLPLSTLYAPNSQRPRNKRDCPWHYHLSLRVLSGYSSKWCHNEDCHVCAVINTVMHLHLPAVNWKVFDKAGFQKRITFQELMLF